MSEQVFFYTKDASGNGIKEVKTGNKVITEVFSQFSVEHFIKPIMAVSLCSCIVLLTKLHNLHFT